MANTKIQSEQIADDVALAGSPTTTTQSASDNSTKVATTAFVTTAVANLVDSAPSSLNTLNELAAAMNDNASFFSTVLPLSGGTMTGNISHASDFTLDVGGDLNLDAAGGQLNLKDSGTTRVTFELDATPEVSFTGGNLAFNNLTQNADIAFKGFDGSSFITALNLDMSAAGEATFNAGIKLGDGYAAQFGASQDLLVYHSSNENIIQANTSDQDLLFKGKDGSSTITALTLDMSNSGAALFNSAVTTGSTITVNSGHLNLASDGANIYIGADIDMRLTHDGSNGTLRNDTGNLTIDVAGNTIVTGPNSATMELRAPTDNAFISIYGGYNDSGAEEAGIILAQNTTNKWQIANTTSNQFRIYNYAQSQSAFTISSGGIAALGNASHADDVLYLTRSDDGNILRFFKGSADLGAINTNGGALVLKGASTSAPVQLQTHDGNEDIEVDPDGFIKFETAGSERLRIDADGIKFHGDTAATNGLNDYEEGTWTLAFNASTTNPTITITNDTGTYTKIGDIVNVRIYTGACGVGSAGSGTIYISGLPFAVANTGGNRNYSAASFAHTNIFSTSYEAYGAIGQSYAVVVQEGSISSAAFATGNGKYMVFSLTYRTEL